MPKKPATKTKKTVSKKPAIKTATKKKIVAAKKAPKKALKKPVKKTAALAKPEKKVQPIPRGYNHVSPCLVVGNGQKAIEFYKKVFDAKEVMRMERTDKKIVHVELQIGDSRIMLADEAFEMGARAPEAFGGSPVAMHLYTINVDAVIKAAVAAGAKIIKPIVNMFYGDRTGTIKDPFGHTWHISTQVEEVSPETLKKRADALFGQKRK